MKEPHWVVGTARSEVSQRLLADPRWELAPVKDPATAAADLPRAARATMSFFASSEGFQKSVKLTTDLIARGHPVTPHLPARSIRDRHHLADLLEVLKNAGVTDIFVVAGNSSKTAGPYDGAIDILQEVRAAGFRAGVAAYPEGHAYLSSEQAMSLLVRKQEYASYLVTQTCFDAATVRDWLRQARAAGVRLPAYLGIAGVVQRKELLRMAAWMGVGNSVKFVNKQRKLAARLVGPGAYDPSVLMDEVIQVQTEEDLGIEGIHLNTFNQVASTRAWWDAYTTRRTG